LPEKATLEEARAQARFVMTETLRRGGALEDVMGHLTESAGKGFRALLLLASAQDAEGLVPRGAVIAAAALEIMHLATLLHDDVIDDADTRRGQPSVQKKFGKKTAVISGDYLFCQCFLLLSDIAGPFKDKYLDAARYAAKICEGELRQFQHNWDLSLTPREYLRIAAGKTSAMFAYAAYAGSVLGGRDEAEALAARRFGFYIGMAFQLDDDCLDYISDATAIKKDAQNDLAEGVITLPLIFSLARDPGLRRLIDRETVSAMTVSRVIGRVSQLGGVEQTRDIAARYRAKAERLLDSMPDSPRSRSLRMILKELGGRKY